MAENNEETKVAEVTPETEKPIDDNKIGELDLSWMSGDDKAAIKQEASAETESKEKPEEADKQAAVSEPAKEAGKEPEKKEAPAPASAPAEVKLDKASLEELKKAVTPPSATKPAPSYTLEDLQRDTQRPVITDKIVEALDAATPAQKAVILQGLFDQAAKHAFLLAQLNQKQQEAALEKRFAEMNQKMAPVTESYAKQQQEAEYKQVESDFVGKYPELKQHMLLVRAAATEVFNSPAAKGITDAATAMSIVAQRAKEIAAASGLDIDKQFSTANHSAPLEGSQKLSTTVPKPMRTLDGGRSQGQTVTKSGGVDFSWMNDR